MLAKNEREASHTPYVEAVINYHDRREVANGAIPVLDQDVPANTTYIDEPHAVPIYDARQGGGFALERNGFTLLRQRSAVADFSDRARIKTDYYPEIEGLIRELTGATEVLVWGDVLRSDDPEALAPSQRLRQLTPGGRPRDRSRQAPAPSAHVDYDEDSVRCYVEDLVGAEEAKRLLRRRFMLVNLWRGVHRVDRMPLAVCDAATVARADLMPCRLRAPVGPKLVAWRGGYNVAFNPAHRWYYYPAMEPEEVLVFKLCDSDHARPQFTAHTSFADPTSPPDAPPRVSFEIRTICFLPA